MLLLSIPTTIFALSPKEVSSIASPSLSADGRGLRLASVLSGAFCVAACFGAGAWDGAATLILKS